MSCFVPLDELLLSTSLVRTSRCVSLRTLATSGWQQSSAEAPLDRQQGRLTQSSATPENQGTGQWRVIPMPWSEIPLEGAGRALGRHMPFGGIPPSDDPSHWAGGAAPATNAEVSGLLVQVPSSRATHGQDQSLCRSDRRVTFRDQRSQHQVTLRVVRLPRSIALQLEHHQGP